MSDAYHAMTDRARGEREERKERQESDSRAHLHRTTPQRQTPTQRIVRGRPKRNENDKNNKSEYETKRERKETKRNGCVCGVCGLHRRPATSRAALEQVGTGGAVLCCAVSVGLEFGDLLRHSRAFGAVRARAVYVRLVLVLRCERHRLHCALAMRQTHAPQTADFDVRLRAGRGRNRRRCRCCG